MIFTCNIAGLHEPPVTLCLGRVCLLNNPIFVRVEHVEQGLFHSVDRIWVISNTFCNRCVRFSNFDLFIICLLQTFCCIICMPLILMQSILKGQLSISFRGNSSSSPLLHRHKTGINVIFTNLMIFIIPNVTQFVQMANIITDEVHNFNLLIVDKTII